jgi:DnaJ-class molecular chaperone
MRGNTFRPFGGDRLAVLAGEDNRHVTDCFADEVVIDFPSVAHAVDRVRASFLTSERPEALLATIRVTLREAVEGATLPLDVPLRCTCSGCGGRGESWTERCSRCDGTGTELFTHQLQVTLPPGVADGARFQFSVTPRHNPSTRIELHVRVS